MTFLTRLWSALLLASVALMFACAPKQPRGLNLQPRGWNAGLITRKWQGYTVTYRFNPNDSAAWWPLVGGVPRKYHYPATIKIAKRGVVIWSGKSVVTAEGCFEDDPKYLVERMWRQ